MSLTVGAGEHVAIVGRTGGGKSSLLSLLAGLYRPWSGSIRLAGYDSRAVGDDDRRRLVGVVPQTVQLFTGTITDNVTLGDPRISIEEVRRAAAITGADAFIEALPQGYDTELSGTLELSAGQRQLLALTRAVVGDPVVLLLDEATASIDGSSDATLRAALHRLAVERDTGILTVAHRLSTARQADRIVVLDRGIVIEQGTPERLLADGGRFATLAGLDAWTAAER
ncbi:ATP-binding cassette domain-containing protein [Actinoplanes aureus]|uniref:ATP-binding cassette domain-containing protein n=1 Tax=Actinoplanes aureus TaxID=2792083 RepID=A0A931G333_9ACTN|nr:ATP-binding cassette domain-containing protein [Actinoplanes aureus]MBG0566656.1 ATP-binding cassette domain-containing protein [Actinoplanes aureus]